MQLTISTDQRISNTLLLNASFIDNLGLMHGKMGISICFFHLARQTGNQIYEDYAGELIDEIYEEITANTPVDFENGLAGIGWGIEYLVQNGFIEEGEDNILEELDNAVFQLERKKPELSGKYNDFFGYGLYYLYRAKNDVWNTEVLQLLWNDIKVLFAESFQEGIKVCPDYLVSLFYFIREIKTKPYCPPDIDKIIATIPAFISGLCPMDMNNCEIYYLEQILHNLGADFSPLKRTSNKPPVSEKLQEELCGQVTSYALLFPAIRPFSDCNPEYKDKVHKTLTDPVFREKILETADDNKYGIYSGLAGYILTILNEGFTDSFRLVIRPASNIPIYIFKRKSRASEYGIGTYIKELTTGLKDRDINITIVHLEADKQEFTIENHNGISNWYIPLPAHSGTTNVNYNQYFLAVVNLIRVLTINTDKLVFHLNCMRDYQLARYLREFFDSKILLVVHYMDWSFVLQGDLSQMKKILAQPEEKIPGDREKKTLDLFKEDQKTMGCVDHIVCLADYSKEILCKDYGINADKITVVNNGLTDKGTLTKPEEKLKLREKYRIDFDEKIILFAGRLDEIKGVAFLIEAFKKVLKYEPNSRLWIIGDGAYNPLFKEAGDYWSKLCFTGKINQDQLFDLYKIADIGVIPSLFEPFGYVAVEMMMNSLPVVVTATGGLDEIVEDRVSGLKVGVIRDENSRIDSDILSQKIIYLLQNPEERVKLGYNGRKRYLEKFTASAMCQKMIKCYQKLVQPEFETKSAR